MRDLMNHIHTVVALAPKAAVADNTAQVGAWIDRRGYESVTFLLITGVLTDANATFAVAIDHADLDDQSDVAAVVEADDLVGTLAKASFGFADDGETRKVGYVGEKRYVRLTVTPTGNDAGNLFLAGLALLGHPLLQPTPNPPQ